MAKPLKTRIIVAGKAEGLVLRLGAPISFWGGVCPITAKIIQTGHPNVGASIAGVILVLPGLIGSSSSSAVLLELLYKGIAPKAILMTEIDAILALGNLVATEMDYPTIPMVQTEIEDFADGQRVLVQTDGRVVFQ